MFDRAFGSIWGNAWEPDVAANTIRQRAASLKHPEVMAGVISEIKKGWHGLAPDKQERLLKAPETAQPEAYKKASEILAGKFVPSAESATRAFEDMASRLKGLQIEPPSWLPGGSYGGPGTGGAPAEPRRFGPRVPSFGPPPDWRFPRKLSSAGEGAPSVPYDTLASYRPGAGGIELHYSPSVTIPGGGPEQQAAFAGMLEDHKREFFNMMARETADIELVY